MEKEQARAATDETEGSLEDALESMIEEAEAEGEAAASPEEQSVEQLVKQLEVARAKADEHWDQLVRTQAQMDNLSKRHKRELENAHKYGLDKFVGELLGVWDSLELGHAAAHDDSVDVTKLLEGTELTLKMMSDAMSKLGVEQVDPMNEPFNPELHQAMSMQPRDDVPANTVVAVVQKGYTLNGRLVRPAMVMVSQG
jgi:molecular chaperone GrpE